MALFDREAQGMLGMLGIDLAADNSVTRKIFGWTPIHCYESIRDSAAAVEQASA